MQQAEANDRISLSTDPGQNGNPESIIEALKRKLREFCTVKVIYEKVLCKTFILINVLFNI